MKLWQLCLCILLCGLAACERPQQKPVDAPEKAGQPALWKIEDGAGRKGWLFGTIHLLPKDTNWQSAELDAAIRHSKSLVLEASGLDDTQAVAQIFTNLGMRSGLPPLAQRVAPSLRPALRDAIARGATPAHVLDRMESWAATLTLAATLGEGKGLDREAGVEQVLLRRYRADQKPVSGLETVAGQLGIFDQLPEQEQRAMLNATLRGSTTNQHSFDTQFKAWHEGRIDELISDEPDGILASPLLRERLLDGRNHAWAIQIAALVKRKEMPFIAVGAAHLPGKAGVVALLQRQGLKLTRLQ